jgi:hypothetical protein
MNKNYNIGHNLTLLVSACLLLSCAFSATTQAQSRPRADRAIASSQSQQESARLIIRRLPNLGANVIVDLYVDGKPTGSVEYGQTFEGSLPPGHHVLSVEATPRPADNTRTTIPVEVQAGETYSFTAVDNGSGRLALK